MAVCHDYFGPVIEILDNLDVLAQPFLDLRTLTLAGVHYGSNAADSIDRERIEQVTLSPIVHTQKSGDGITPEYYDAGGQRITLDEVVGSVIDAGGMLHIAGNISYKIAGGTVVGFALYGAERGPLAYFSSLRSHEEFLTEFGTPDSVERNEAYGELLGLHNYYWGSKKQAYWDSWDERLSSVNLGDYDGNHGPRQTP
ncbi:hypothetical protein MED15_01637 [Micromonospora noduli]|uniref:Uncharacterized protein n=1 Tax=Micromonospora noduli TaxID=709876 RepID=A0ABX9D7T0_9ACTN|nr:hypothetical protein MED15_01637 [Micromonospora noduli]